MTQYQKVTFRHANVRDSKDQPMPVHLVLGTIAGFHWSDKSKATHIYTTGGIFPVLESAEEVDQKLQSVKGGINNG